jgi:phage shock protein A
MMDSPDLITTLKRVIDEQHNVNFELRECLQEAQAEATHWREQAEAFEAECRVAERRLAQSRVIPWAIADEIEKALQNGNCAYARRLWEREAQS